MEIRHLRAFVAVAEELHFTRAARRLCLAQQALSNQIRQLEAEVGVELLYRTTRHVEVTEAGRTFLGYARQILDCLDEAKAATRNVASKIEGELRIGYTYTLGLEAIPAVVRRVHRLAPQLKLHSVVVLADQAVFGLSHGQFDLAVLRSPQLTDDLSAVTIRHEPLGVILGAAHRCAADEVVAREALAESTLVIWPRWHSPGYTDRVLDAFAGHRNAGRVLVYENFSPSGFLGDPGSRAEIFAGRAFQLAVRAHYDPVPEGFVWRPLRPELAIDVDIVHRTGRLSPAQRRFVQAAQQVSAELGWLG